MSRSARARRNDPNTSRAAAKSVGDLTSNQRGVMFAYRMAGGPLLDEELVKIYPSYTKAPYLLPRQSESGLRSRRSELAKAGRLVEAGKRKMSTGRMGRTFTLSTNEEAPAE